MAMSADTHSDDQLIKRLQIVMRDADPAGQDLARADADRREGRNLAAELAGRVFAEPEKWGLASVPADIRDDAAADTLVTMLSSIATFRGQQPVNEWFASQVQARARELAELRQRASEGDDAKGNAKREDAEAPMALFASPLWEGFERQSPREAFILRVRCLLLRTPDEMADMLEAPTSRAVSMRLNRARDRFRIYCERSGVDARTTEQLLHELGEGRKR